MGKLLFGDCLEKMKTLPSDSVDSIVCDPPYGLSFMGKKWDYDVPTTDIWKEALRVLKPGGHLLAFGGTRTYHRLVVAIEDAGFEIRDQIQWLYGQGFPKSTNIAIGIDKQLGAMGHRGKAFNTAGTGSGQKDLEGTSGAVAFEKHVGVTPEAQKWSGYGTALKPANEPICLARKPLSEKTVAKNVLKHGVGGLNIDGTRIAHASEADRASATPQGKVVRNNFAPGEGVEGTETNRPDTSLGRFPSNVILDESAAEVLDGQTGVLDSGGPSRNPEKYKDMYHDKADEQGLRTHGKYGKKELVGYADKGGASRFFYVAKASKSDRGEGNVHPTVKPVKLMEYLVKLVTPAGGTVLDPFMGSGTTGVAALNEGFDFIGCERDQTYFEIAKTRILAAKLGGAA